MSLTMDDYLMEIDNLPIELKEYVNNNIEEFKIEHEEISKINNKRNLSELEKFYVLSNIPSVSTISPVITESINTEIAWKTKILIDTVQIYPALIDELRAKIMIFANSARINPRLNVSGDAVDAIMEPVMQASLDSFRSAGEATNTTGNINTMKSILDISSKEDNAILTLVPNNRNDIEEISMDIIEATFKDILLDKEVGSARLFTPNFWYEKLEPYKEVYDQDLAGIRLKIDVDMMKELNVKIRDISNALSNYKDHIIRYSPPFKDVNNSIYMFVDLYVTEDFEIPTHRIPIVVSRSFTTDEPSTEIYPFMVENIGSTYEDYLWYNDFAYYKEVIPSKGKLTRAYYLKKPEEVMDIEYNDLEAKIISNLFDKDNVKMLLNNRDSVLESDIEILEELKEFINDNGNFTVVDYYFGINAYSDIQTSSVEDRDMVISRQDYVKSYINVILINSIDKIILTGNYNIKDANVDDVVIEDLIMSSYSTNKGTWMLVFKPSLIKRYRVSIDSLLIDYKYRYLNNYIVEVFNNNEPNLNVIDLRYINTINGNFKDAISDIRFDGELSTTDNINQAVNTLGIEAARSVLISNIASKNKQVSSNTNYRHLMLFADVITRSGKLTKTTRLGKYEPSSFLNVASLSSALTTITDTIISNVGSNLDIYGNILIGQKPPDEYNDVEKETSDEKEKDITYENVVYEMPVEPTTSKFDEAFLPDFL